METSDIKSYFEKYLKQYTPYKNSKLYEALIDYFLENFTTELYQNIPTILKQLYENNFIDYSVYGYFLESVGVPKNVIRQLSDNDKTIFFNNITDFYRYRGDIDFFSKVTKLFPKIKFDIYELYVDYDEPDWVFKPRLIVKNTDGDKNIPNIKYNEVYNDVPSLLVNETQLTHYKENTNVILPYKSNILLLDCSYYYEISSLISLIISTFIKEYKSYVLDIYFEDYMLSINIGDFYLLWNYILLKYYNITSFGGFNIEQIIEYSEYLNPYSIDDIEGIIQKFNNITNAKQARDFYEEYISNHFKVNAKYNKMTHEDVKFYIDTNIINYLEQRILTSSEDKSIIYNNFLNEMFDSLLLYISNTLDPTFKFYSEYFVNSLTRITIDPKNSSTYILLNNFKPFHTEMVTQYSDYIFIDNNLERINPDDSEFRFVCSLEKADVFDTVEYNHINILIHEYNKVELIEHVYYFLKYIRKENNIFEDEFLQKINQKELEVADIIDICSQIITKYVYDSTINIEENKILLTQLKNETLKINENNNNKLIICSVDHNEFNMEDINTKVRSFSMEELMINEHINIF